MSSRQVSIMVKGVPQPDEDRWEHQRALIERSGAIYCRDTRAWWLHPDLADGQQAAVSLACLFKAASKYGAKVRVLDPVTEMPVSAPALEEPPADPS